MKLEAPHDKLEEAKFFLGYLNEIQNQRQSQSQTPFRYYLSAFLGATYSVEQYLQAQTIRALRQQARTQGKKLSKQKAWQQYNEWFAGWFSALLPEHQALWDSLMKYRRSEIHTGRTKTETKEKAIPVYPSPRDLYGTERSWAYAAIYVAMQQGQQVAPFSPDIPETTKRELGFPSLANAWTYVQEHHLEIKGVLQAMVKTGSDYVALLEALISHFEQSIP